MFVVLAVATGLAAGDLVPQAVGALGTLLVWLILAPVTSWSGVAAVAVYHGSVWTLAFTGGDRWAVFGVSLFMAVAQALNLGLWSLKSARAGVRAGWNLYRFARAAGGVPPTRWLDLRFRGCITGVLLLTRCEGRRYSDLSFEFPHGLPVFVFFHFSAPHRFRFRPAFPLRTWPCFFRHAAIACEARALGNTAYRALTE